MRLMTTAFLCIVAQGAMAQSFFERMDKFYVGGGWSNLSTQITDERFSRISAFVDNPNTGEGQPDLIEVFIPIEFDRINFHMAEFFAGYKHGVWLNGEIRIATALDSEDFLVNNSTDTEFIFTPVAEYTLEYAASAYWRPEVSNEVAKFYGLLGVASMSIEREDLNTGATLSDDATTISYGLGVGFAMFDNWNFNVESRWVIDNDDYEFTSLGASIDFRF